MAMDRYLQIPLWLAPMAGVIGSSFRRVVRQYPCGLVFTELLSAKGLLVSSKTMALLTRFKKEERPIAFQLYGSDPCILAEAAVLVKHRFAPEVIDINMGCPSKKIVRSGAGAALMGDPNRVLEIVETVSASIAPTPLTVKIRSGLHQGAVNAVEVALAAREGGASAITVHPRTRAQGFKGKADWRIIGEVARACSIPVIGSGDVVSPQDAKRMICETGCAGVMIGRGALGRPWLFLQAHSCLQDEPVPSDPVPQEIGKMALRQLLWEVEDKGERRGVMEMRKHLIWYSRGMPFAKEFRRAISSVSSLEGGVRLVVDFFSLEEEQVDWIRGKRAD
jgi:tRNA-dihydrouridine synthase B